MLQTVCLFLFLTVVLAPSGRAEPPVLGEHSPDGTYVPHFTLVYEERFEGETIATTTGGSDAIEGNRSLMLGKDDFWTVGPETLQLRPDTVYYLQYDYRIIDRVPDEPTILSVFSWEGFDPFQESAVFGPLPGEQASEGTYFVSIRTADKTDISLSFISKLGAAVVDRIQIFEHELRLSPPKRPVLSCGFPRLSNFHVYTTTASALINHRQQEEIIDVLSRFDLTNGLSIDHTFGNELDHFLLREKNPDLLILPYIQTFVSVLNQGEPYGGSSGLVRLFNQGLQDEWFMLNPDGERLAALLYPDNYQMDHTSFAVPVNGRTFTDYLEDYLRQTVLPSGLWDGLHFDQSEWEPNPLLGNPNPFLDPAIILPPIDLDRDGAPESEATIYAAWYEAYEQFFSRLSASLGPGVLFFGNAGEMSLNSEVLARLNGFQFEFFSPYDRKEDGTWKTDEPSLWYRHQNAQALAKRHLRAPQVPSTQLTGYGLGTPNGRTTANGLDDREPVLTTGDYRRMRFGLSSALLQDGFFGYDFVDNSTAPIAWFDEFGVDHASGTPDPKATDYLGQPLGEATELDYEQKEIFHLDFEGGQIPPGINLGPGVVTTDSSDLVLEGAASGVLSHDHPDSALPAPEVLFSTDPAYMPLEVGKTYQLFIDYQLAAYSPETYGAVFSAGIAPFYDPGSITRFNLTTIWHADARAGQRLSMRTASKVSRPGETATGYLSDTATIVIDSIRLVEGTGGAYRRDFEYGVVLANPTPEEQTVSLPEIAGPLQRTGLRHIAGVQAPTVNDGSLVAGPVTIGPGDGLILLADALPSPAPETPLAPQPIAVNENELDLFWEPAGGTVAGYLIRYGIAGGDLESFHPVGTTTSARLKNLQPGTVYAMQVSAYDYLGNESLPSETTFLLMPGSPPALPVLLDYPNLVPGEEAILSTAGADLTNAEVTFNGLTVDAVDQGDGELRVVVPDQLSGGSALVSIDLGTHRGPTYRLPVIYEVPPPTWHAFAKSGPRNFIVEWTATPGERYSVEVSTDLRSWSRIDSVLALKAIEARRYAATEKSCYFRVLREDSNLQNEHNINAPLGRTKEE